MHDIVIRGGEVVDGTGTPPRRADVAIDGDRITEVGVVPEAGRRELDASGRLVTPGFVDVHTHLDAQLFWDPIASSSCWHGVTTVVLGNCGVTFAPVRPGQQRYLAEMMEAVEDIPAETIMTGLGWDWETYGEYLTSPLKRSVEESPPPLPSSTSRSRPMVSGLSTTRCLIRTLTPSRRC